MKLTARVIAEHLNGIVEGNPLCEVSALSKIEEATPDSITFIANPKYFPFIYTTKASVIIVADDFKILEPLESTLIRVNDPYKAFSELLHLYEDKTSKPSGIVASSSIHTSVKLEAEIYIGANVVIENDTTLKKGVCIHANSFIGQNVTIGENTIIHPNVIIYSNSIIGDHCVIHSGTVIGADGFGFASQKNGSYKKIPQTGNVIVGNYADIGANTTIDRATIGSTQIGDGVKLDNQVQIAHNVQIGKHTVIAAQSGIAGSSQVGDYCVIGGQVGIIGHLKIGNHVRIQGQSGVIKNIPDNTDIQGSPAIGYRDFYRSYAVFRRLPEIEKKISQIKKD
tara:strand:- start:1057 stop:2070 length:1014 start_codon:yes stop_codon:yes gene_type:complete